jgi:uncharacterized repeat protein (TIGR03803 family)
MRVKRCFGNLCNFAMLALLLPTIARSAPAQTYSLIHTFTDVPDGATPNAIIQDAKGNIYGTTRGGGIFCFDDIVTCGAVYKVDPEGNETIVHAFQGGGDGAFPDAALIEDAEGNFYGTTAGNGSINADSTIFKIDREGKEIVLWDFDGPPGGGSQDEPLARDNAGNLYGSSPFGGDVSCGYQGLGCGTLYRLTPAGTMQLIHTFTGPDGIEPEGGLVVGVNQDAIYGTTVQGGNLNCISPNPDFRFDLGGCGTIFRIDSSGKFTTLHEFTGQEDGSSPLGIIQDSAGNLYGIASYGGGTTCVEDSYGCGTIFKFDTTGKFFVLYHFTEEITQPDFAPHLTLDAQGNIYGVNQIGGTNVSGFIFEFTTNREFRILFNFPSTADVQAGSNPQGITIGSAGNFYGAMLLRGSEEGNCGGPIGAGCGTLFKVSF